MPTNEELEAEARRALGRKALEEKNVPVRFEGGLGGSPVAPLEQVRAAAVVVLHEVLPDSEGALLAVFEQDLRADERVLGGLTGGLAEWTPAQLRSRVLGALAELARRTLASEAALEEFTRRADAEWGRLLGERPFFQAPGRPAHPDDPYTFDSVRRALDALIGEAVRAGPR